MYNFFALFLHQAVKNSHKTSIYKLGFTTAVSIFRKVEKNKRELKPLFYEVLALFILQEKNKNVEKCKIFCTHSLKNLPLNNSYGWSNPMIHFKLARNKTLNQLSSKNNKLQNLQ